MKKQLLSLARGVLLLLVLTIPLGVNAQFLIQDFEPLTSVEGWASLNNPSFSQVNKIESNPTVYFELKSTAGDKFLALEKRNSQQTTQQAFFVKDTDIGNPAVLRVQFDLNTSSAANTKGVLGSFYVGQNLGRTAFFPDNANRFATIDLNFAGGNAFTIANAVGSTQTPGEISSAASGDARVTLFLNNTDASFSYMAPSGEVTTVGAKNIDIWIGNNLAVNEAASQAKVQGNGTVAMSAIKFVTRNNGLEGSAGFDNFLIQAAEPATTANILNPGGGTYTVGVGGQFLSLTNPGGVFDALNRLGSITGSFTFRIISDLLGETGAIALNQIPGASAGRNIQFRPGANNRTYLITGDNEAAKGAIIRLNGADWVRFDGRVPGDVSEGINVNRRLIFRNTGTAPTFHFFNDATNNIISYSIVQGASNQASQGVVLLGNASAGGGAVGNDKNSFLYNRIGGYGSEYPVNALASVNTTNRISDNILVKGNQFYSFGIAATQGTTLNANMPCAVLVGRGNNQWLIQENHFFQEDVARAVIGEDNFVLQGVCVKAGTEHNIEDNFLGGSLPFTNGRQLRVESEDVIAVYPSLVPFSVEAPGGVVNISGNTVNNIFVSGSPFVCDALAVGSRAIAGTVNFINNTFGDPLTDNPLQRKYITAQTQSSSPLGGSYLVAPIYYVPGRQVSGRVENNFIGSVRLEGNRSNGFSAMKFVGVLTSETSEVSEISRNTIADVRADVNENVGAELIGIFSRSLGNTTIARNVIYDFSSSVTAERQECILSDLSYPGITGIIESNGVAPGRESEVLIANNMISFQSPEDFSTSVTLYNGIRVSSVRFEPTRVYHNSVLIYGADNAAADEDFVFYRSGTTPTDVKNNIFINTRITDNPSFVIGTRETRNFSSDYNVLYQREANPSPPFFAVYGAGRLLESCQAWIEAVGATNSKCENVVEYFINPDRGNLRILQTLADNPVIDAGVAVEQVPRDIDFVLRINPDIGASEGFNSWIGVVSTDWFDPRNWSAGRVPTCEAYNLLAILPTGTEIPVVTINGQNVSRVEHQPIIRASGVDDHAVYRNLIILERASVTIGNANAHLEQCPIQDPGLEGIHNQGTIEYTAPGMISLRGILNNDGVFLAGTGTLTLNGEGRQLINSNEQPLTLWNVSIEGGGRKVLVSDVLIQGALNMVHGIVQSTTPNTLTMYYNAVTTGNPSDTAYVAGRIIKVFNGPNQEFVFPLGDAGELGLIAMITRPTANQRYPVSFAVEYYLRGTSDPGDLPPTNKFGEDVKYVSDEEVWRINQIDGKAAAQIALYWDGQSGAITNIDDAYVVRWEPTLPPPLGPQPGWVLAGGESTIQNAPPLNFGPRVVSGPVTFFTFFTFGSVVPETVLPVDLVSFTAKLQQNDVKLEWETAMEMNSSHFNIQRSQDGVAFETVGSLSAAGTTDISTHYNYTDAGVGKKLAGTIYYRLEQVDVDGTTDYSPIVLVKLPDETFAIKGVYPNPFKENLVVNISGTKAQRVQLRLLDMNGKQLLKQQVNVLGEDNIMPVLDAHHLEVGMYILEVTSSGETRHFKVVKK